MHCELWGCLKTRVLVRNTSDSLKTRVMISGFSPSTHGHGEMFSLKDSDGETRNVVRPVADPSLLEGCTYSMLAVLHNLRSNLDTATIT